jgi:hypothetical protein
MLSLQASPNNWHISKVYQAPLMEVARAMRCTLVLHANVNATTCMIILAQLLREMRCWTKSLATLAVEHLFVGAVDRRWRGRYLRHCVLNGRSKRTRKFVTRHHSVLVRETRLQLALQSRLRASSINFDKKNNAVYVVKHSIEPQAVIAKATSNGAAWSERLPACAAAAGNLQLLIWLRSRGCPWKSREVVVLAARSGSVAMLQHLRSALCSHSWSQDRVEKMFEEAG